MPGAYDHPNRIMYRLLLTGHLDTRQRRRLQAWAEAEGVRYSGASEMAPGGVVTYTMTQAPFRLPADLAQSASDWLGRPLAHRVVPLSPATHEHLQQIVEYVERRRREGEDG